MKIKKQWGACLCCAGLTLALFVIQAVWMRANLARIAGTGDALALSGLYAAAYGAMMAIYVHVERPKMGELLFAGVFSAVTMLARVTMLDFVSADYASFLAGWVEQFREGGVGMLAQNVGDYNLPYQYILLLISNVPLSELYLIKYVSVCFDGLLALVMMRAAGRYGGEGAKLPAFLGTLVLPTVLLNGACWGQCDSVYAFFIVASLYLLETDRPMRSAAMLAIAFSFKLQTIFFFPVVLLGLIHKRYTLRDAAVFFGVYLLTLLPALAAGKPLMDALAVYANQSMGQYYDRLTYTAPNLYQFFPMLEFANSQDFMWLRYVAGVDGEATHRYLTLERMPDLQSAALYACVVLVLLAVIYWLLHWREITPQMTLTFALFFAIFLPFVMPKIHERYFFLADMLAMLYAVQRRDRRAVPMLVVGASLMSYVPYLMRQRPIDERWLGLMMLAALLIVSRDLLEQMRKNRAALGNMRKGGEAA